MSENRYRVVWSDGKSQHVEVVSAPDIHQAQSRIVKRHGGLTKIISVAPLAENEQMDETEIFEILQLMADRIDELQEQYDELVESHNSLVEDHEPLVGALNDYALDPGTAAANARANAKSAGSSDWADAIPDGTQERNRGTVSAGSKSANVNEGRAIREAQEAKIDKARQSVYADWFAAHSSGLRGPGSLNEKNVEDLYPDLDSTNFAKWHRTSGRNQVDDHSRSDKKDGYDRAGNPRSVYSGSTKVHDRKSTRQGNTEKDAEDSYDLGNSGPFPKQRPAGNRGSAIPIITSPEEK